MAHSHVTLGAINMEARDPADLARFWAAVTGGETSGGSDAVYLAPNGPDGFGMFFQRRTEPRPDRQDTHLDLTVPWGSRVDEVRRLTELGAVQRWDVLDEVPHVQWTTMEDPEGNLFCIAEHPPKHAPDASSR
ncbi:VOC family protein [Janibacter sp. G56]|uniref:VOC family protein n=1 Tax=Janibacter sp. G56 TaxID=3418717 RepID=UPI003D029404